MEVKLFACCGLDKVHPPKRKPLLLVQIPLLSNIIPGKVLWKFLICMFVSFDSQQSQIRVCFKVSHKSGSLTATLFDHIFNSIIQVECYYMMAFEMDLKVDNRWDLVMHFKLEDPPSSL